MSSTHRLSWFEQWPLDLVENPTILHQQEMQGTGTRRKCTLHDQPLAEELSTEQGQIQEEDVLASVSELLRETPLENTIPTLRTGYHLWTIEIDAEDERKVKQWSLSLAPGNFPYRRGTHVQYRNDLYEVVTVGMSMLRLRPLDDGVPVAAPSHTLAQEPTSGDWQESRSQDSDEHSVERASLAFPEATFFSVEVPVNQLPVQYRDRVSEACRTCWVHEVRETTQQSIFMTRIAETPHRREVEPIYLDAFIAEDAKALDIFRALTCGATTPSTITPAVVRALPASLLPDDDLDRIKEMLCSRHVAFALKEGIAKRMGQPHISPRKGDRLSAATHAHLLPLHDIVFVEETGVFNDEGEEEVVISPLQGRLNGGRQSGRIYRAWLPTQVVEVGLPWDPAYNSLESHEQCRLVAQHLSEQVMMPSYAPPVQTVPQAEERIHQQENEEQLSYLPIRFALGDEDENEGLSLSKAEMRGCKRDQGKLLRKAVKSLDERKQRKESLLEKEVVLAQRGEQDQRISYSTEADTLRAEISHIDHLKRLLKRLGRWYATHLKADKACSEYFVYYQPQKEETTLKVYENDRQRRFDRPISLRVRKVVRYTVKIGVPVGVQNLPLGTYRDLLVLPTLQTIAAVASPVELEAYKDLLAPPTPKMSILELDLIRSGSRPEHLSPKSMGIFAEHAPGTHKTHRFSSENALSATRRHS